VVACDSTAPCTETLPPAFVLQLVDKSTGAAVCNGSVLFTNESAGWMVSSDPNEAGSGMCLYQTNAPTGMYTITITAPGYQRTQLLKVQLLGDTCGVIGQDIRVPMPRDSGDGGAPPPPPPPTDGGQGGGDAGPPVDDGGGGTSNDGGNGDDGGS
jgi:hypothetical protein